MTKHEYEGDQTATIAVIEAVAAVSGTEPTELPPLYEAISPGALNELWGLHDRRADSDLRVEFSYNGFDVVVQDGPYVTIREK